MGLWTSSPGNQLAFSPNSPLHYACSKKNLNCHFPHSPNRGRGRGRLHCALHPSWAPRRAASLDLEICPARLLHRAVCSLHSVSPPVAIPCRTPSHVTPIPILCPAARGVLHRASIHLAPSRHGLHCATTAPAPPGVGRRRYSSSPPDRPWPLATSCFEYFRPMFQVF